MSMSSNILVVDDREGIRSFIKEALLSDGYNVDTATDGLDAITFLKSKKYSLLITDLKMPRMSGMELLRYSKKEFPGMVVLILTAHGTINSAVEAIKEGAFDYLTKPLESPKSLRTIVAGCVAVSKNTSGRTVGNYKYPMIAQSPVMKDIMKMIDKVSPTDATVLLEGVSGTGKEVAARNIHQKSSRKKGPFVAVNCAAISPQLVESEMFGHEKGAFTGADESKIGRFEMAHGGTLFLDEIGEFPMELQPKLLRVLQEKSFERVGGTTSIMADVRIVAATNKNLLFEIKNGNFREDLYHRLSVFPIVLPPLKDRPQDILPIAENILELISTRLKISNLILGVDAVDALIDYPWPGNIRQLGNVLERAAIMCNPPTITATDLNITRDKSTNSDSSSSGTIKNAEKDAIINALTVTDGHRKNAADLLGISLRSLYNKLKQYNID